MKNLGLMIVGIGSVLNGVQSTEQIMELAGTCFIIIGVWIVAYEVFHEEN